MKAGIGLKHYYLTTIVAAFFLVFFVSNWKGAVTLSIPTRLFKLPV